MTKGKAVSLEIELPRARVHWHERQGLAAPVPGAVEDVIAATGWLRTLGGADVYVAARALFRDELGHARSFTLDTDAEIRKRVKILEAG